MGLDTLEILMDVEDEFHISIPDQVASSSITVGDTHRVIVAMLVEQGVTRSPELEADVWRRLITIVSEQMRMKPQAIRPESRWIPDITKYG